MNSTALRLIKHLTGGTHSAKSLMETLGIKRWQFNEHVKRLIQANYIKKNDGAISLQNNAKAKLLLAASKKYDIERLLHDSNEQIFALLAEPFTVDQICSRTGFSSSTVYRAVSDFESIGIVSREQDRDGVLGSRIPERIRISAAHYDLITLARILKAEQDGLYEPDADIIFKGGNILLKKVSGGKITEGETTAYSLFSDYGVQYSSPYDYYVKQNSALDIHDVLIHSVVAAHEAKDRLGLIMAVIFYLKNKEKFDTAKLRRLSRVFEIASVWLDVEGYIRRGELKNSELFLPWEEFVAKAQLYSIPPEDYVLPSPAETFFADIGRHLSREMTVYLIGGENMRIKNLKAATKDCDIVVESSDDFQDLRTILTSELNYSAKPMKAFSAENVRHFPSDVLEHAERSRVDLFTRKIMRGAVLSPGMIDRADIARHGKLAVALLRNEDVFLLKAVASREGDIEDMALLARGGSSQPAEYQHGAFDWDVVWEELLLQERMNPLRDLTVDVFQQLSLFSERTAIKVPFMGKLRPYVLDLLIKSMLRGGPQPLKYVADLLEGGDISGKMIRNRVDALVRKNTLSKKRIGGKVHLSLVRMPAFCEPRWGIKHENLQTYLDWRFPLRKKPPYQAVREFSDELTGLGYADVGEVDQVILRTLSAALLYESERVSGFDLDTVELTQACIGLASKG